MLKAILWTVQHQHQAKDNHTGYIPGQLQSIQANRRKAAPPTPKMTGAPKPIPAHQWPKNNWHTPVVYQILTDAN